jgi:hypothetical protein
MEYRFDLLEPEGDALSTARKDLMSEQGISLKQANLHGLSCIARDE